MEMKLLWLPLGQGQSKAFLFINPTIQQSQGKIVVRDINGNEIALAPFTPLDSFL
jgi:hypothetical protein